MLRKRPIFLTRSEIQESYYRHTGGLSTALRQLMFGEGAAAWMLFVYKPENTCSVSFFLLYAAIFAFLLSDACQYWYLSNHYKDVGKKMDNKQPRRQLKIPAVEVQTKRQIIFFECKRWLAFGATIIFLLNAASYFFK